MAKKKVAVISCPQLKPYIEKLGLKWKIKYVEGEKDGWMQIGSDPQSKTHFVSVPKSNFYLPDGAHELCHAALAERIDIQFAAAFLSPKYAQLKNEPQRHFKEMRKWFTFCWGLVVDIWADDLCFQLWPEFIVQGINDFNEKCVMIEEAGQQEIFSSWEMAIGIAMHMGEIRRFNLFSSQNRIFELLARFDAESQSILTRLSRLCAQLPALKYEQETDLKSLEEAVSAAKEILNFPINPRLAEKNGRMVWELS